MKKTLIKEITKNSIGFSLVEILVALTLLSVAGTLVVVNVAGKFEEGKISAATIQMQTFGTALDDFKRHCNRYPTSEEGLDALVNKPSGGKECKRYAPDGYLKGDIPLDPWDSEYIYELIDKRSFQISSAGQDEEEETDDDVFFPAKK